MDLKMFYIIFSLSCSTITGTVYDNENNEELTGVRIVLNEKDTVFSDFNGEFTFSLNDSIKKIEGEYVSYSEYYVESSNYFKNNEEKYCVNQ